MMLLRNLCVPAAATIALLLLWPVSTLASNVLYRAEDPAAGIELVYQNFRPPVYPQLCGDFAPGLSIIDLLFNCGPDARQYLETPAAPVEKSA